MTPEEERWTRINNALQTIAENQAGHDARMAELETRINKISEMTEKNAAQIEKTTLQIDKNAGAIWNLLEQTHRIGELTEKTAALTEKNAIAIQDLTQSQTTFLDRMDIRFDRLEKLLEKWFREGGRNGH